STCSATIATSETADGPSRIFCRPRRAARRVSSPSRIALAYLSVCSNPGTTRGSNRRSSVACSSISDQGWNHGGTAFCSSSPFLIRLSSPSVCRARSTASANCWLGCICPASTFVTVLIENATDSASCSCVRPAFSRARRISFANRPVPTPFIACSPDSQPPHLSCHCTFAVVASSRQRSSARDLCRSVPCLRVVASAHDVGMTWNSGPCIRPFGAAIIATDVYAEPICIESADVRSDEKALRRDVVVMDEGVGLPYVERGLHQP